MLGEPVTRNCMIVYDSVRVCVSVSPSMSPAMCPELDTEHGTHLDKGEQKNHVHSSVR